MVIMAPDIFQETMHGGVIREPGTKSNKPFRVWTEEEMDHLNNWYGIMTLYELSKLYSRTEKAIAEKARRLGIGAMENRLCKMDVTQIPPSMKGVRGKTGGNKW